MKRPRCPDCGLAYKDGTLSRHQQTRKHDVRTSAKRARQHARTVHADRLADRITARAKATIEKHNLVRVSDPSRYPKVAWCLEYASPRPDGKVRRSHACFVPRWQAELVKYLLDAGLARMCDGDDRPATSETVNKACKIILRRVIRNRHLRAEIESVRLLGDPESVRLLLDMRMPGVWGAWGNEP